MKKTNKLVKKIDDMGEQLIKQCFCESYYDEDNILQNCSCGKCADRPLKPTKQVKKVKAVLLVEKFNKDGSVDRWLETSKGKVDLPSYPKDTVSSWPKL